MGREGTLGEREENGEPGAEERGVRKLARHGRVSAQDREAAPGEPEPEVGVEPAAGELEVVGEHEEDAQREEHEQPGLERDENDGADRACRRRGSPQRARRERCPGFACRADGRGARRARARRSRGRARTPPRPHPAAPTRRAARGSRRSRRTRGATPCTGGAAASRSRASRPARARRRPAARRSRPRPPHDDASAEAEPPCLHVSQSCVCPHRELTFERVARPRSRGWSRRESRRPRPSRSGARDPRAGGRSRRRHPTAASPARPGHRTRGMRRCLRADDPRELARASRRGRRRSGGGT